MARRHITGERNLTAASRVRKGTKVVGRCSDYTWTKIPSPSYSGHHVKNGSMTKLLYYNPPSRLLQKARRLARSDQRRAQGFLLRYGPLTTRSVGSCIYPRIRTAAPEQMSMLLSVMGTARSPAATTGWLHSHRQMPLHQVFEREKSTQLWGSHCDLLSSSEWHIPAIGAQLCLCTNESRPRERNSNAKPLTASSRCQRPARTADMHHSMRQWLVTPCRACLTRTRLERLRDSPSNVVFPNKEIIAPLRLGCEC